jgi:hypothetical protein
MWCVVVVVEAAAAAVLVLSQGFPHFSWNESFVVMKI